MFSRLTAAAAVFAIFAAASLTVAAGSSRAVLASRAATTQVPVVQLERVVVTAKRLPEQPR